MLGTIDTQVKQVTVVGGGIAGLLMAYRLDQLGFEVHLFEKTERLGGLIQTELSSYGLAECAAHSMRVTPLVKGFLEELDLPMVALREEARARYVLKGGTMKQFPLSFLDLAQLLSRSLFTIAPNREEMENLTIKKWGEKFLGSAAVQYLINPMIQGIYGVDSSQLALAASFPSWIVPEGHSLASYGLSQFWRRLSTQNNQNKSKFKTQMMTPLQGMSALSVRLGEQLHQKLGARLHLGQAVEKLPESGNVILTTPAYVTAELLKRGSIELSERLQNLEYTPLISANLFIRRQNLRRIPKGVGVLIPKEENFSCLGVLFHSSSFQERISESHSDMVSLTAILGGAQIQNLLSASDSQIEALLEREIHALFGLQGIISEIRIHRWPKAIPRCDWKLMQLWSSASSTWCKQAGHVLFGNYTGQISIRGMIESVVNLRTEAESDVKFN